MTISNARTGVRWLTRAALAAAILGAATFGAGIASADNPPPIGCPSGTTQHRLGNGQVICLANNFAAKTTPQPGISVPLPPPSFAAR